MDISEFNEHLIAIRELMIQEKYSDALVTIDMLKELDKKGDNDFSYNLMHQLYQLDSNCRSAFHQQIILKIINDKFDKKQSINFTELSQILRENDKLKIDDEVLKKEVELLILRNLLKCKIEGNQIIFLT
ncbi:hypothetical protein LCGC14_3052730 [marine sediment metagenome]|uniref:PCI domain-containing protein n=1 Tax=marine sediment metagenome TaxID=412755 RepID=A0A0F8ZC15_9ZZZZ